MLNIGSHLSVTKGFPAMGRNAIAIDANTFQFFTRNPRGGRAKAIDQSDINAFLEFAGHYQFAPLLAHAPYTLNAIPGIPTVSGIPLEIEDNGVAGQKPTHEDGEFCHPRAEEQMGLY